MSRPAIRFHRHAAPGRIVLPVAGPRRRPHWLDARRVRAYALAALVAEAAFALIYLLRWLHGGASAPLPPCPDFSPLWSAAWLAAQGQSGLVYDPAIVRAVEWQTLPALREAGIALPWLYPPTMLAVVLPLGILSYWLALGVWLAGAAFAFVAVVRALVPRGSAALCTLAFPGLFVTLLVGQTSLLSAALAGLGLAILRRHPVAAGWCFGMLIVKPQVALLFPLALVCAAQWRALLAWGVTVMLLAGLATALFGPGSWLAFVDAARDAATTVGAGHAALVRMPTWFAAATLAGWPPGAAQGLQAVSALAAAAAVGYAWRGAGSGDAYPLRAAVLVCASLMTSPYLYDYDLVWFGLVIAWLVRHALVAGWRRGEREGLVVLWLAPLGGLLTIGPSRFAWLPLVSTLALAALVRRLARERHAAPCVSGDENNLDCEMITLPAHGAAGPARASSHQIGPRR